MRLGQRAIVSSLVAALPAAGVLGFLADRRRAADLDVALERVVRSQINDQVRERCESDPTWFLTGPLQDRPKNGVFVPTHDNDLPPRPKEIPQPFELFAYDEEFIGSSSASARFPPEFRRALRARPDAVKAPHVTPNGMGSQIALPTGWIGSTCSYFLGRMDPPANQMRDRMLTYLGIFVAAFLVAWAAGFETVARIRKRARDGRASVDAGFTAIAPDSMKDELSNLTFIYNDAANELHQRKSRIDDLDAALKRFIRSTADEVAKPLAELSATLGAAVAGQTPSRTALESALQQAHDLGAQVENLTAAARLKSTSVALPTSAVDVNAVVTRVVARHMPVAECAGVKLHLALPPNIVVAHADEALLERAIANVMDNAVRYNQPGGDVTLTLSTAEAGKRFRLTVLDTGHGVTDEEFRGLTAVRRFRGDEGRNRRPGAPGLGLAVAREVCDRFGFKLDLKRPGAGGFEAEISGEV
jgi:signal transduction histidine kinase